MKIKLIFLSNVSEFHIQYKKVVVPGKNKNNLTSNAITWHKWRYLMSKNYETELNKNITKPLF
jgi:hypothetical protein